MKFLKFICLSCALAFSTASYSETLTYGSERFHQWAALLLHIDQSRAAPVYINANGSINYTKLYADTPSFAIFLTAIARAQQVSATLNWSAPNRRIDGSALSLNDLSRYEIYMTDSKTGKSSTVKISNVAQTSYQFKGLAAGKYYFSMASVDKKGKVSPLSGLLSKTVK